MEYVADAKFVMILPGTLAPAVEETLHRLAPDPLHREQYLDFLKNQPFRRSLLCQQQIPLSPIPKPKALAALHVASAIQPLSEGPDRFRGPDGRTLTVTDPLLRTVLLHLHEVWPETTPFEELRSAVRSHTAEGVNDGQTLETLLLNAYVGDLVELHVLPARCVGRVSARPIASPLARYQASAGARVTNLRHETIALNPLERHLLRHLDGSRDRHALIEVLVSLVAQGILGVSKDGVRLTQPEQVRSLLDQSLDQQLVQFARRSLLVG